MSLQTIDPAAARRLIDEGAILVDIREADEHARERVPGARHAPLSRLGSMAPGEARAVIFHCRSGARTAANAARLAAAASCQAYILEGGIDAWKKAGLPVLAGDSGGAHEALSAGTDGRLVDPRDTRSISELLVELLGQARRQGERVHLPSSLPEAPDGDSRPALQRIGARQDRAG